MLADAQPFVLSTPIVKTFCIPLINGIEPLDCEVHCQRKANREQNRLWGYDSPLSGLYFAIVVWQLMGAIAIFCNLPFKVKRYGQAWSEILHTKQTVNCGIQGEACNLAQYLHHKQSANIIINKWSRGVMMEDHNLCYLKRRHCNACCCKEEQWDARKHL